MPDTDYEDNIVLFANIPIKAESLLHRLEQEVGGISLYMNANKIVHIYFKQKGAISTLSGKP